MSSKTNNTKIDSVTVPDLLPRLRFPQFSGSWRMTPLNKLAYRCTRKNKTGEIVRVLTNSAEFGVLDQRDYFDKDIANPSNLASYFVVEKGDYVYNPRISATAPVGPISKNNVGTGVMSPLYTIFRFTNNKNDFFAYYFKSTGWHRYMRQASSTGARHDRMAITNDDFMAMPVPLASSEEEQLRIAACLASIDELVTFGSQELTALKDHKKALMQQLFPSPRETSPAIRFPEFQDAEKWQEKMLGDLGELVSGLTYSPQDVCEDGLLVLRSSNVQHGAISLDDKVFVRKDVKGVNLSKPDDILICVRNGSKSLIGKNALIPEGMPLCTHGAFMTIFRTPFAKFVYQLLQTDAYERQVAADLGATINSINGAQLKKYKFYVPGLAEQQKISDCLSCVDTLINSAAQRVETLKTHRTALIQKIFPLSNEATE